MNLTPCLIAEAVEHVGRRPLVDPAHVDEPVGAKLAAERTHAVGEQPVPVQVAQADRLRVQRRLHNLRPMKKSVSIF